MAKVEVSGERIPVPGARYDFEGLPSVALICRGISLTDDSMDVGIYEVVTTHGHMAGFHTMDDFIANGPDTIPDSTLGEWLGDVVAGPLAVFTLHQLATIVHREIVAAMFDGMENL